MPLFENPPTSLTCHKEIRKESLLFLLSTVHPCPFFIIFLCLTPQQVHQGTVSGCGASIRGMDADFSMPSLRKLVYRKLHPGFLSTMFESQILDLKFQGLFPLNDYMSIYALISYCKRSLELYLVWIDIPKSQVLHPFLTCHGWPAALAAPWMAYHHELERRNQTSDHQCVRTA